jgi:lipoprotein-anchoring transpeptidase ErfK/SrfK
MKDLFLMFPTPKRWIRTAAATSLVAALLAACGHAPTGNGPAGVGSDAPTGPSSSATPSPAPPPVQMKANVADGAQKVAVDTVVSVKANAGELNKVTLRYSLRDRDGKQVKGSVPGTLAKDGSTWTAKDRLEPGATYRVTMVGENASDGRTTTTTSSFTTQALTLAQQTFPSISPAKGSTVGIGMPVVIRFDVPVKNRAEFEKNLVVKSTPAQKGTWHWFSNNEVHYRPKAYWKPGTKVSVEANLNGLDAGNGVYGQKSTSTKFKVGRSFITKVDLRSDVAKVYRNGKLVRSIYVTGGKPGWETRSGIKLISAKEYNKVMTNEAIGAKEEYRLVAKYAMRITNSGEFLHSAPWSLGNLGRRNASHGCVGMSIPDSGWLYENTLIGDPVVTTGTNRGIEKGNGLMDWDISWSEYKKGSAL